MWQRFDYINQTECKMKINVENLSGAALAWSIASVQKTHRDELSLVDFYGVQRGGSPQAWDELRQRGLHARDELDWSTVGPVMERERISLVWMATHQENLWFAYGPGRTSSIEDPDPLVAAVKAYQQLVLPDLDAALPLHEAFNRCDAAQGQPNVSDVHRQAWSSAGGLVEKQGISIYPFGMHGDRLAWRAKHPQYCGGVLFTSVAPSESVMRAYIARYQATVNIPDGVWVPGESLENSVAMKPGRLARPAA